MWINLLGRPLLFILAVCLGLNVCGQTIQYTRQNIKAPSTDFIQLVPNVSGFHHILCFAVNGTAALYVYDNELQLVSTKEMQIKPREYDDINIIPFKRSYFLYIHSPGSSQHELWKIDPQGNATSMSDQFMALIDTAFKKSTATLQLVNKNNRLFVVANGYYDELGKIRTTVVEADENLKTGQIRKVFYEFNKNEDRLHQVSLIGDDLLVLKTSRDTVGHLLQVTKANLNTGELFTNSFNSGSHLYSNPTFAYNPADSSIVIHSVIERTVFVAKLDYWLNEKVPVTLLRSQFKNNTAVNFLQLEGTSAGWLRMRIRNLNQRVYIGSVASSRAGIISPFDYNSGFDVYGNLRLNSYRYGSISTNSYRMSSNYPLPNYGNRSGDPTGVRFSVLNNNFKILNDSLAANDKNSYSIDASRFANVVLQNQSYLFLGQQFGSRRQGLLMVYGNNNGDLSATDIRVYDKYEYLLQQLKAIDNKSVILPYRYKRELGLVKITFE